MRKALPGLARASFAAFDTAPWLGIIRPPRIVRRESCSTFDVINLSRYSQATVASSSQRSSAMAGQSSPEYMSLPRQQSRASCIFARRHVARSMGLLSRKDADDLPWTRVTQYTAIQGCSTTFRAKGRVSSQRMCPIRSRRVARGILFARASRPPSFDRSRHGQPAHDTLRSTAGRTSTGEAARRSDYPKVAHQLPSECETAEPSPSIKVEYWRNYPPRLTNLVMVGTIS